MVCLGNICRSPLAEGILQDKALKSGYQWKVESAGTGNWHVGEPPHPLSIKVAALHGIDIGHQRARQFVKEDFKRNDFIYVMDSSNYSTVKQISGSFWEDQKIELLMNELYPGENRNVPDPWFGNEDGYHTVFTMLNSACENIIKKHSQKTL